MSSMIPAPTRARMQTLEAIRSNSGSGGFDVDAWHVMEQRDNALIEDELLNGAGSNKFVYEFDIGGKAQSGISVIGARHLASIYGGLKHRLVSSVQKTGSLFTFTSYASPGMPMLVSAQTIYDLEAQEDFYAVVVELTDVKTANTLQVEKRENRWEVSKNGTRYERPHYALIAQSKAFRNGVLDVIPQDTQLKWKLQQLQLGKQEIITGSVIEEKRSGVLRFAAARGLSVDRRAIEQLRMEQIGGLSDAARSGKEAFVTAAQALRVLVAVEGEPVPSARADAVASIAAARNDPPPPTAAPRAAARTKTAPKPEGSAPPFGVFLVDDVGEMSGDEWSDPVGFARALGKLWENLPRDARPTMLANNDAAMAAAAAASDQAAAILRDIRSLTSAPPPAGPAAESEASDDDEDKPVPVPTNRAGTAPAWPLWLRDVRNALVTVTDVDRWLAANLPTIKSAPDVQRLSAIKAISEHAVAIGKAVPAALDAAAERGDEGEGDAPDRDAEWTSGALKQIEATPDANSLRLWATSTIVSTRMDRFRSERPELWQQIDAAVQDRERALGAGAGDGR